MHPLTWLGIGFILIGVALVLVPILSKVIDLRAIPSWIVYFYRSDGFIFVTSPLLIILSIVSFLVYMLVR